MQISFRIFKTSVPLPIDLPLCVCGCCGLVCEDVEGDLGPLLLDVLDKKGDLHGAPDLHSTSQYSCTVHSTAQTCFLTMLTRAWYPMRLFMVTLFWMTRAVMGMRGNTVKQNHGKLR